MEVRRSRYDLLVMKYKGICRLYGDLCIVRRTALSRLNGYDGLLEDLPAFISSVLQSLLWSMLDVRGMFEVWETMKSTNEPAPTDDFNTLHRQMDQLKHPWSCLALTKLNHPFRDAIGSTLRCRTLASQRISTRYSRLIRMTSSGSGRYVVPSGIH